MKRAFTLLLLLLALSAAGAGCAHRRTGRESLPAVQYRDNADALRIGNLAFRHGDWLAPLAGERYDLIASNPPYIAAGGQNAANLMCGLSTSQRDFDAAFGMFAEDIVFRIPGRSSFAGEHRGRARGADGRRDQERAAGRAVAAIGVTSR